MTFQIPQLWPKISFAWWELAVAVAAIVKLNVVIRPFEKTGSIMGTRLVGGQRPEHLSAQ